MACAQAVPAVLVGPQSASAPVPSTSPSFTFPSVGSTVQARLHDFVKYALLQQLVPPGTTVCDLCCEHGSDTEKWARAQIGRYIGVDFSKSALEVAHERWNSYNRPYQADFFEIDPFMADLQSELRYSGLPADFVCCMQHLQDCFFEEDFVRRLLWNVASVLKPGGYFFGITPDSSTIWSKYQKAVEGAHRSGMRAFPRVKSEHYVITFEDDGFTPFGTKYTLQFTDGAISRCQALIHFPSLIRLAEEFNLEYVEIQNLQEFYEDYRFQFNDILRATCGNLLDPKGKLMLFAYDILSLYTTFIFKKSDDNEFGLGWTPFPLIDDDNLDPSESMDVSDQHDDHVPIGKDVMEESVSHYCGVMETLDLKSSLDCNQQNSALFVFEKGENTENVTGSSEEKGTANTKPIVDADLVLSTTVVNDLDERRTPHDDQIGQNVGVTDVMEGTGEEYITSARESGISLDRSSAFENKLSENSDQKAVPTSQDDVPMGIGEQRSLECEEVGKEASLLASLGEAKGLELADLPPNHEVLTRESHAIPSDFRDLTELKTEKQLWMNDEPNSSCTEVQPTRDVLEADNYVESDSPLKESNPIVEDACQTPLATDTRDQREGTVKYMEYNLEDGEHAPGSESLDIGRGEWGSRDSSSVLKHAHKEEQLNSSSRQQYNSGKHRHQSCDGKEKHEHPQDKRYSSEKAYNSRDSRTSRERGHEEHKSRYNTSCVSPRFDDYRHHLRGTYQSPSYISPMVQTTAPVFKSPNTPGILGPGPPGLRIKDLSRDMYPWALMSHSPSERKGPHKGWPFKNSLGNREAGESRGPKETSKK